MFFFPKIFYAFFKELVYKRHSPSSGTFFLGANFGKFAGVFITITYYFQCHSSYLNLVCLIFCTLLFGVSIVNRYNRNTVYASLFVRVHTVQKQYYRETFK